MNAAEKQRIGQIMQPALQPFHEVEGCNLKGVWQTFVNDDLDCIQLEFEPGHLVISVDPADDTLGLAFTQERRVSSQAASHLQPWNRHIGKSLGWGWLGINQQGYMDGVGLSFGSGSPQVNITAVASSLRLTRNFQQRRAAHKALYEQGEESAIGSPVQSAKHI